MGREGDAAGARALPPDELHFNCLLVIRVCRLKIILSVDGTQMTTDYIL